jgi:hypothetical protein
MSDDLVTRAYAFNQEDIQTQPWIAQGLLIDLACEIERLRAERVTIPEGYAVVPVEPTQEMMSAACAVKITQPEADHAFNENCQACRPRWHRDFYLAMLAASRKG